MPVNKSHSKWCQSRRHLLLGCVVSVVLTASSCTPLHSITLGSRYEYKHDRLIEGQWRGQRIGGGATQVQMRLDEGGTGMLSVTSHPPIHSEGLFTYFDLPPSLPDGDHPIRWNTELDRRENRTIVRIVHGPTNEELAIGRPYGSGVDLCATTIILYPRSAENERFKDDFNIVLFRK